MAHAGFWKEFEHRQIKPRLRRLAPWRQKTYAGLRVHYKRHLDGGGSSFGQDFIPLLHDLGMPKQQRVFEWCAGPGFIGFSLLAHGLCETLCLADVNPEAIAACRRTIADNRLADRVSVYCSNNLGSIPAAEPWDLVVSNPPHFIDCSIYDLRSYDEDWRLHRSFFADVGPFLKPGGIIILQENNRGSTPDTFRRMAAEEGLSIVFTRGARPERTPYDRIYFMAMARRADSLPSWVPTTTSPIPSL